MLYDHRDEHKQNVVFAVKSRAGTLFVSLLICSIAVYVANCLFSNKLFESLSNGYVRISIAAVVIIIIFCEIKSICSLYRYLDFMSDLRELETKSASESLQICTKLYRRYKSSIDTVKIYIDVFKSLSPIPLAVLLFGFLIDKSKSSLLSWNIYTVVIVAVLLIYIIRFRYHLINYRTLKQRLLEIEDTYDKIRQKLHEKSLSSHETDNNAEPIFKGF
jgi:membrane protein YdbS with pleckstrin-like domain